MAGATRLSLLLLSLTACKFPEPPDLPGNPSDGALPADASMDPADATPSDDAAVDAVLVDAAPEPPGSVIRVSPTGDDASDGIAAPVKTLKRAIAVAGANQQITTILVASGRYDVSVGEAFPYTVPPGVTIAGPVTGGAILAGTGAEPGLFMDAGRLRDLQLEQFTVAITGRGATELSGVRVRASGVALRGTGSARLTVNGLDMVGSTSACSTGVELLGNASMTSADVASRVLGIAFDVKDQSTVSLSNANIAGDRSCDRSAVFTISSSMAFSIADSTIDGGEIGLSFTGTGSSTPAVVTNTAINNMDNLGVGGGNVLFRMTGGELLNNRTAVGAAGGTWNLDGVPIRQQRGFAFELGSGAAFAMRNCMNIDNVSGIYLYGNSSVDLGTNGSPGGNVFRNRFQGTTITPALDVEFICPVAISAVGNSWHPNVQGANTAGQYGGQLLQGPQIGDNFKFPSGCTLQL